MKQVRNTKQKYGFRKIKYVAGLASAMLASVSLNTAKPQTVHADTNTNTNLQDNRATGEKAAKEELDHIPDNPNSKTQTPSQKRTVHIIDDSTQQDLKQEKPVKNTPNVNKNVPNKDVETPKTTDNDYIPDNPKDSTTKTVSHVDHTVDNNTVQIADKDYILDNPKDSPTKTVSHVDNTVDNNTVQIADKDYILDNPKNSPTKTVSHVDNSTLQTSDISTAALDLTKKQIITKSAKMAKLSNNLSLYNTSLFALNNVNTANPNTVFPNLTKDNWQDPASWGLQKTNAGWTYSIPQYVADSSNSYFMDGNGNKQEGTHVIGLKDQPATYRTHINAEINPNTANASTNSDVLVASTPILTNDPMEGMVGHIDSVGQAALPPSFCFKFAMNHSVYDKHGNYIGYLWFNVEKGNDMQIYWHNTGKNYADNVNINFDFDSVNMDKGWPNTYQVMAKTGKEYDVEFVNPDSTVSNWREVYNPAQDDYPYYDNIDNINVRIDAPSVYWQRIYLTFDQDQSLDKTDVHTELYHKVEQDYAYDKQGNIVKITSAYSPHFITSSKATDGTQTLGGFRYDLYTIPLKRLADNLTSQQVYDQTPAHSMSYSLQTDGSVLTGYNVSPSDAKYNEDQVRDTVDSLYYTNYQHPEDKQKWINATIDAMKKRNWVAPHISSLETFLSWDTDKVVTATALDVTPNVKADIQKNTTGLNNGGADAAYLQTATLNFIDDDDHDKVISHQLIMGPQDKTKSFLTNVPNDYVLADPSQIIVSHHFVYNDKSVIDIHVKHKIIGTVDDLNENAHNDRDYLINQIKSHQVKDLIDGVQDDANKDLDPLSSNISIVQDPDQTYTAKYDDDVDINNKLSQINNDYIQQQNDIINQFKDWSNKAKAYNATRNDFINKLKQEGLWTSDSIDPTTIQQNFHLTQNDHNDNITPVIESLNSHTIVNDNKITFNTNDAIPGDFAKITYNGITDSYYRNQSITKMVVTLSNIYKNEQTAGSYITFDNGIQNGLVYVRLTGIDIAVQFYDSNGNLINFGNDAYITVGSLNSYNNFNTESVKPLSNAHFIKNLPQSYVKIHPDGYAYIDDHTLDDQSWDGSTNPDRIKGSALIQFSGTELKMRAAKRVEASPYNLRDNNNNNNQNYPWFIWSTMLPQLSFDAQAPKLELHYHNDNLHLTKTSTYQVIEKMPHPTVDPNKYGSDQVILKTTITAGKDIARDMVTGETKQTKFLGKYTSGIVDKGHTDGVDQTVIWGSDVGLPGYELDPFYAETKEQYDDPNNPTSQGAVLSVSDSGNTIHFDYLVGRNYYDANGVEMSDLPNDQTWYVTMHPLAQHVNIVYVDNDTNETVKTTPLQGVTDEQINLTYEAPANYTIAPDQSLPNNYLFTASDNSDIDVWLNHATQPTTQTHTAKRIFKLQFNGQDIKHDYVQTGTITITGNQDLLTGDSDNGNYSLAQWNEITKDDLTKLYQQYGYQTNGHDFTLDGKEFTTINTVEIDPDTQDETHIINVVPTKRPINYIDIATNNTIASDSVQGVTNAVIKYAPNVPYGYELVTPQASYSIPISGDNTPFDIYVKSSMIHIDHTKPHHKGELIYDDTQPNMVYPNNVDEDDLNQTITRTINVYEPDGVINQIVQKVVLYRDADYDLSHHTTTYTPWQANGPSSWDSYTAPEFDGYTPDLSYLSAATPLPDSQDVTINIHYKETGSEVLLAYNDTDESDTEVARYNEGGEPNSTIQIDWLNHITQDMPGYEIVPGQVINGQHLDDLLKNHASLTYTLSDVNRPIIINIRHIDSDVTNTDPKAKSSSERTLTIIEPNSHKIVYTQHVDFIRTATRDQATGLVSYGDWHVSGGYESDTNGGYKAIPANNQSTYTVDEINIPAFANYETKSNILDNKGNILTDPNTANILPSVTVSPDSPARNYLVTYHSKMNDEYFDDNSKQLVDGNKKVGNTINTNLQSVTKNSIKNVYHYVPHFAPTTVKIYTYVPHFAPTVIKAYQSIPTFSTKLRKANTVNPELLGFKQSNIQVQKPHNLATLGLMTTMLSLLSK